MLTYVEINLIYFLGKVQNFRPCKAPREKCQAAENLLTSVELLNISRCYHGNPMIVHDTKVVHTQTITHCNGKCKYKCFSTKS